jgi:hypothetical protein
MVVASLFISALLQAGVAPPDSNSAAPTANAVRAATFAPAASSADTSWYHRYHRATPLDTRLMPTSTLDATRDTVPRRRRAVEYSDWYYRRLQVHRWGSWLELPVFGAEYWLGQKLLSPNDRPDWVKPSHGAVAGVLGGLFTINTVTGLWNLYDSREDTDQRTLVWSHSVLMLAADAGFAVTGLLAQDAGDNRGVGRHRTMAVTSMGLATAGTLIMWIKRGL